MFGWTRILSLFGIALSCGHAQRLSDLSTLGPSMPGDTIVIGFLGGLDKWDDPNRGVRKVALDLRSTGIHGLYAETIENRHRRLAREFVLRALDSNRNGKLDPDESAAARVVLYGQSLGGEAAIDLARELSKVHVPVLLTVQVDSVGLHAGTIPPNVAKAANFYQHEPFTIRGRQTIHAADPARTTILGNFQFHYDGHAVDESSATWVRRTLGRAHAKMELDPAVWQRVERLILDTVTRHE